MEPDGRERLRHEVNKTVIVGDKTTYIGSGMPDPKCPVHSVHGTLQHKGVGLDILR